MLVRTIVEPLSLVYEIECPVCGSRYRAERFNALCPLCVNGSPKKSANLPRYRARGNRQEQEERGRQIWRMYQEKLPTLGKRTTGYIAKELGLLLQTVQEAIRRERNNGDKTD